MKKGKTNNRIQLYTLIPQWRFESSTKTIIGMRNLYLVHTCGSDYFVQKVNGNYNVYNSDKELILKNVTKEKSIKHIREICEANLLYCYQICFKSAAEAENISFYTNAPEYVFEEIVKLISEKKDVLFSEKNTVDLFQSFVKDVFGYLIQEQEVENSEKKVSRAFKVEL